MNHQTEAEEMIYESPLIAIAHALCAIAGELHRHNERSENYV
jgi:hypothetical protein